MSDSSQSYFKTAVLGDLFEQSHEKGRKDIPVVSLTMDRGLVRRDAVERRVESNLTPEGHRLIRKGELAYNMMRMWQGVCWLATFDCLTSPAYVVLSPCVGLDPKFAEYLLRHADTVAKFKSRSFGVVDDRLRLYYHDFRRVTVALPTSLAVQQKIGRILTTLDCLITKTEALIAKYEVIKQGMMYDLFTRGVDEHGHLRPSHAEAPKFYRQSESGWIPKDWESCELGAVVPHAQYGVSVSLDDVEGIPVLRMNNLIDARIDVSDIKCSRSCEAQRLRLQNHDVLFNRTNSIDQVGRTSIWREELPEASFASYLVRLIPNARKLLPHYLVMWLNLPATQIAIRHFATPGVHQVNINPTNLRRTMIAFPSDVLEQSLICKAVQQQDAAISQESQFLAKLRVQKSGLMQDLLTGKVRVKADESVEVAAHA